MATVVPPQGESFNINTPATVEDLARFLKASKLSVVEYQGGHLVSAEESDSPLTLNDKATKWTGFAVWGSAVILEEGERVRGL